MNLNKLQYFITVYEEGCITAAAKKHFISQVAMSQQIKALEDELDVTLFLREKNKLHQTGAAHYLYSESKKLLQSYNSLLTDIKNYSNDTRIILHIGINYYSLYEWIKPYTKQFEQIYNDITIVFEFFSSKELISQLDKGFLDIVLIWDEYAANLGLNTCYAFSSRGVALIPPENPLANIKRFNYSLLKNQRVVVLVEELPYFRRTGHLDELLENLYAYTSLKKGDILITDNINQALLLASEENIAILTYEDKLYKISQNNLTRHFIAGSFMEMKFVFAWKQDEENSIRKSFLRFINQVKTAHCSSEAEG